VGAAAIAFTFALSLHTSGERHVAAVSIPKQPAHAAASPDYVDIDLVIAEAIEQQHQQQEAEAAAQAEAARQAQAETDAKAAQEAADRQAAATQTQRQAPQQSATVATQGRTCAGSDMEPVIRSAFAGTGAEDYFLVKAYQESNCQPGVTNTTETCGPNGLRAKGLLQLCGHDGLLVEVCPAQDPSVSVFDPNCNAKASRVLFDGSGFGPWGG